MISPFHDVRFESDVSVTSDPRGESRPFLFIHLKSHPSLFQCGILFELFYQVIQTFVLVHNRILSGRKRSIINLFRQLIIKAGFRKRLSMAAKTCVRHKIICGISDIQHADRFPVFRKLKHFSGLILIKV